MYLSIGSDMAVRDSSIIGIFDMDTATYSRRTRETLSKVEQAGQLENAAEDLPKSFVVCSLGSGQTYYLSQLSSATLQKRSGGSGLENL